MQILFTHYVALSEDRSYHMYPSVPHSTLCSALSNRPETTVAGYIPHSEPYEPHPVLLFITTSPQCHADLVLSEIS